MMLAFLPIILMLGIVIMVNLLVVKLRRTRNKRSFRKREHWMLGSYVIVLIISVGLFFLIPNSNIVKSDSINSANIPNLYDVVYDEIPLATIDMYMKEQWNLDYDEEQLELGVYDGYEPDIIRIERKDANDGKLEASYYETPTIVGDIDVSKDKRIPQIKLLGSTLEIITQDFIEVNLTAYKSEFPIMQFTGVDWWMSAGMHEHVELGLGLLNIRIPKDMEIIADEYLGIHYVGEASN